MAKTTIVDELRARVKKLEGALADIRDLARTGTAPNAYSMTVSQWDNYKVNKVAAIAAHAPEDLRVREWPSEFVRRTLGNAW